MKHHRSPGAFTLIELMVVIMIIAVLAALLVPAVTSGIKKAKNTQCLNNLRQIGMAVRQYIADPANNQAYPSIQSSPSNNTNITAGPVPPSPQTPAAALGQYGYTNKLGFCPADTNSANATNNYGSYTWTPILNSDTNNPNSINATMTNIYNTGGSLQIPSLSIMTICVDSVPRHPGKTNTMNVLRADGHVEAQ